MAYELNKKLSSIDLYVPVDDKCIIRLDSNESCYNIADKMGDILPEAVKGIEFNRYPDSTAELVTKAFADYYNISPESCTVGNGSDELINTVLASFLEKGDNILTLSPDFSMYAFYGFIDELKVNTLPKKDDLNVNISKVIEYCNNNDIKAVIFSNPCNPTSLGVSRQDIIRLVKNVFCLVIIDEAYMDFWGESVIDMTDEFDNLVILKTCSKNMGMAALRLGFAVAGEKITAALRAVKSPYNVNTVTQCIACAVLKNKPMLEEYTAEIIQSRERLQTSLSELGETFFEIEKVYDSVTNFVFVRTPKAALIHDKLLEKGISVRLMGQYLRITAGTESENGSLIASLKEILASLNKKEESI